MANRWRAEDLLDLERCSLAAELASTNLESGGSASGLHYDPDVDFSEVWDSLVQVDNKNDLAMATPTSSLPVAMAMPTDTYTILSSSTSTPYSHGGEVGGRSECFEVLLKAPSAYGIKTDQEKVTYLNRGYSYEIQLQHASASPVLYKSTLSLGFCELRLRNTGRDHFEQWGSDHPQTRLLEIDSLACAGLSSCENDEANLSSVHFVWGKASAVLAIKINCLSTEFAPKKHGGERGVPLRLYLEMHDVEQLAPCYVGACGIKVFKDKGGDRKQRQDQAKLEKLPSTEQAKYHASENTTSFTPLPGNGCDLPSNGCGLQSASCSFNSHSDSMLSPLAPTPGASPYTLATPPSLSLATPPSIEPAVSTSHVSVGACLSVEDTQQWLQLNRFGQYSSLFANYTGADFLPLSRRDLMELCGHADGIRLYNSVQSRTLRTLYVRFKAEDKVYQAVCLEELTAQELLLKLLDKLVWLDAANVGLFVRLTSAGLLVRIDNTVVQAMQQEDSFLMQTVKGEDGCYQVVLQDCAAPASNDQVTLSLSGSAHRH